MNTKIRYKKITLLHIIPKKTCLSSSYNHQYVCVWNTHIVLYFPFLPQGVLMPMRPSRLFLSDAILRKHT